MKKVMIALGILVIVGIIGIVAFAFLMKPRFEAFQMKAKQAEAKTRLNAALVTLMTGQVETGEYRQADFDLFTAEQENPDYKGFYKLALSHPLCADCGLQATTVKIVAFGNIDDDSTEDVWTIDQDRNLIQLSDDIQD